MLVEKVVHLQVFTLKTARNRMVTHRVRAANHYLLGLRIEGVGLATVVLTEVNVHLIELHPEFREVLARNRLLQEVDVTEGVTDLGREPIVPIGIPVDVVSGQLRAALIKVLIELKLVQIAI